MGKNGLYMCIKYLMSVRFFIHPVTKSSSLVTHYVDGCWEDVGYFIILNVHAVTDVVYSYKVL